MAAAVILYFQNFKFFNGRTAQGGRNASPRQIWLKSVKTRLRYGDFSIFQDGGRPPSWICCVSDWTTHEGRFGVLYHCAKLGWNRCGSFDDMQVLVFCDFGLKTPIHALFWGVFGAGWLVGWLGFNGALNTN